MKSKAITTIMIMLFLVMALFNVAQVAAEEGDLGSSGPSEGFETITEYESTSYSVPPYTTCQYVDSPRPPFGEYRWHYQDFGWQHTFDPTCKIILSVTLEIRAWDVDAPIPYDEYYWERDKVYADGVYLGELRGGSDIWSITAFAVDPALLADGILNIWLDIDADGPGYREPGFWAVTIDWSKLCVKWEPKLTVVDLIAGGGNPKSQIIVGTVTAWNDKDYLYVTYSTTLPWVLTETHLAVAIVLAEIPQANGNPIPGQFLYSMEHYPWVTKYTYKIPLIWKPCTPLYIAAHAVVLNLVKKTMTVVSDTNTWVTRRRSGNAAEFEPVNAPAVYAWEPGPNYPNDPADDAPWQANSLWDTTIGAYHTLFDSLGADWIWESYRVKDPVYGTVLKFNRSFKINGYPIGGTLTITCDNGYEAFLNSNPVGSDNVYGEWLFSDLKQAYVDTADWQGVEQYDVSGYLQSGMNTLLINAANEYFDTDDYGNPWPGTASNNPAGCIFALCIDYYPPMETAWGAGEPFPGANWATYFMYKVCPCP